MQSCQVSVMESFLRLISQIVLETGRCQLCQGLHSIDPKRKKEKAIVCEDDDH